MAQFTMLNPSPPFEAYLRHMKDCVSCCNASRQKEPGLRCGMGQRWMTEHDKLQADRYQTDLRAEWERRKQEWQEAFCILRNIKGREATDTERMIFNLAKTKGLTFNEAVILFESGTTKIMKRAPNESLNYNPETGEMISFFVTTEVATS